MGVLQVAELPGLTVGWDGAGAGEDVGVAIRGAGPGAGVSNCVCVEVHRVCVGGVGGGGARAFRRDKLEEDRLVFAVFGVGAGVDAQAAVSVAPGAGADGEADVGESVTSEEDGGIEGELVKEGTAGPDGTGGKERGEDVDKALEVVREGGEWGCSAWECGGIGARVVLHLPSVDFHGGLGVAEGFGAGEGVGDGLNGGVLAVGVVVGDGGGGEDGRGNDFDRGGRRGLAKVEVVGLESWVGEREDGGAEVVEEWGGGGGVYEVGHCAPEMRGGDGGDGVEVIGSWVVVKGYEEVAGIPRRGVFVVVCERVG
jgi:hypothetical protein